VTALTVARDGLGNIFADGDGDGAVDFYSDGVTQKVIDKDGFQVDAVSGDYLDDDGAVTDTPVFGGVPIRLSGGSVETGLDGTIHLGALGDVELRGLIGDLRPTSTGPTTSVAAIHVNSTAGTVQIYDLLHARNSIDVGGADIQVLDEALVKTRFADSDVYFRADNQIFIDRSTQTQQRAKVSAATLVHLYGGAILLDGVVEVTQDASAKVLLNAVNDVTITGQVDSTGDVKVHAGVRSMPLGPR
jgi:hypothetical protein